MATNIVLPVELERYIFEISIAIFPQTATTLVRLSKYVHDWLVPLIYEVIVSSVKDRREPGTEAIERYGPHIRHLLVGWDGNEDVLTDFLTWSPNIINLAVWCNLDDDGEWKSLAQRLPIVRLSIHPASVYNGNHTDNQIKEELTSFFSSFPQLTHLDIASEIACRSMTFFDAMPKLTYLSLYHDGYEEGYDEELPVNQRYPDLREDYPSIKFLIFLKESSLLTCYTRDTEDRSRWVDDPRAMGWVVPSYVDDWENGARGRPDVWKFATRLPEECDARERKDGSGNREEDG
ncbi:hypothetical protein BDN72DRAFT_863340 [Pluteus cervinus]|uniref:Uncharacterized protein n=1 Tax=Pluteus cervinus TaxID=181527 RepID=A0ACD3A8P7_9AGAR|nr:hypothetical protein BDN72DRAFT_863340 [Pluteus cervinus]